MIYEIEIIFEEYCMYIVIVGCGKLGSLLAQDLSEDGHDISVIDHDGKKLDELGSGFNGKKIKGIEFDNDILIEAGIKQADYLISVTSYDDINITVSLIAKQIFHVPHIVARNCEPSKQYIYDKLGIATISPTRLSVDILKSRVK